MDSPDDVVSAIESAFAGVPRGRVTLHEAEAMDRRLSIEEATAARKRDPESDWRDVPAASIEECRAALCFVDADSWRFYLPAYMRLGLRHLDAPRNLAIDVAIYSLDCGAGPPEAVERNLERFRGLRPDQAAAVRRFLTFASQNEDLCDAYVARQALDTYWAATG